MKLFVPLSDINHLTGLDSILRAHLSQYFSSIIAPSVPYLTSLVARFPHCIQNAFLFGSTIKGSILWNFFSNKLFISHNCYEKYLLNTR